MKAFRKTNIALITLSLMSTSSVGASDYWSKMLENSRMSKLRAEFLQFQLYPVSAPISSKFGERLHPIKGSMTKHFGIDLAADEGNIFVAVADGKVVIAGENGSYGNLVVLHHKRGVETRYAHAKSLFVTVGQRVKKGEVLGVVGQSGAATGPHVHFEILKKGKAIDPQDYIYARQNMTLVEYKASIEPTPLSKVEDKPTDLFVSLLTPEQIQKTLNIHSSSTDLFSVKKKALSPPINQQIFPISRKESSKIVPRNITELPMTTEPLHTELAHIEMADKSPINEQDDIQSHGTVNKALISEIVGVTILTNHSMWSIARDLKRDIGTAYLSDIIKKIVELNPKAFRAGNADYRLAHVPLFIPSPDALSDLLPKTIITSEPMWTLATSLKKSYTVKLSIFQVMAALTHKNPEAFIRGNINMRLGDIPLRLPVQSEVEGTSYQYAVDQYQSNLVEMKHANMTEMNG